ncbi:restriction endonuclease subunit S [Acinetobacter lwoffii]|uniref:restriction endonuclease subunit S n=1 Tax=Acinetobacter lwoffii TaxID=28090 RepID=UPI0030D3C37B
MAKYQKYAEYKDSGIDWLGEIPRHWKVSKIGFHTSKIGSGKTPKGGAEIYQDEGVLFLRSQNIYNDGLKIEESESVYITDVIHEEMSTSKVFSGDILLNITGGSIGRSCLVPTNFPEANVNQHVCIIRVQKYLNEFLSLVIKADLIQSQIRLIQTGGNREGLNFEQISKFVFMLPPQEEQKLIIGFLDYETAKIDSLIAKQEKLIELLKEKRQAVISHAVTKGLNPDVPMKDSGVEWLGEVPAHWEVSRVGWLCEFISYGFTNPMPSTDEGPYMLTATDIEFGRVKYEGARRTSIEAFRNLLSPKSKPQAGDILVTKDGTLGRTALFDGDNEVCISQSVALLRLHKKIVLPEFLVRAFSGADYQSKIIFDAGGTTIKHIYISTLSKMNFVLPPMHEQKILVDELKIKLADMDRLIDQAINASNLLGERRTALISSAVTGKIDVRNWQHPNEAKTEFSA